MSDSEKPQSWKERRQSIRHRWLVAFIFPEWLCEWFSYFLGRWAFIDILGHVGRFAVLLAVISYIRGCPERQTQAENQRKAKHYQAWQVINSAQGKPGGGGRKDALEDLHKDGIPLVGMDISKAFLPGLNLAGADLRYANLAGANLYDANLAGASLAVANVTQANLAGANLVGADLVGADLRYANLAGASLQLANLAGADLYDANLAGANLMAANLAGADLRAANLAGANLPFANLAGAYLWEVNLKNMKSWRDIKSIKQATIYGVQNPPEGFIEWATAPEQGAVLIKDEEEWKKLVEKKRQEKKQ